MKKIICLILCLIFLMTALIGCGKKSGNSDIQGGPSNSEMQGDPSYPEIPGGYELSISGIDAAKLLLAEERLNEKLLNNEGDIFENGVQVMNILADKALENLGVTLLGAEPESVVAAPLALASENNNITALESSGRSALNVTPLGSIGEEKQDIGNMEVVGDTIVWTEIDEVSNSYEYFLNLTNNIVAEANRCAELIDFVKKNIRIVDKWVVIGNERYYLSVGENEELLCQEYRGEEGVFLITCRRFRNEDGKDVYEMYTSQESFERRITYIPGERYELSENRIQHFIATNTKGYWENYVLGDMGTHYNVSYLIMKDDICYTFGMLNNDFVSLDILSSDRQTDLFHYSADEYSTTMLLKLNGFANIEKITAPKANAEFGPENDYANLQFGRGAKVHITGGNVIEENQLFCNGKVLVEGISVMAIAYGYGAEMHIRIEGSPDEAIELFKQFLKDTGLVCRRDIDTVIAGTKKSITDSRAVFKYYQWNGYTVNTEEGIRNATLVEKTKYDDIYAYYNNVKNAESVTFDNKTSEEIQMLMSFPNIVGNISGGAKMVGGKLTVGSLTLTVNDVMLFVKDEPYHVVFALEDSTGAIVHLEQSVSGEVKYAEEKEFSVTASNVEITLPHLTPGTYRVVAYIATSEGIRSSKFATVAFEAVDANSVNLGDVDLVGALGANGELTLTYIERVDVYSGIESESALSYDAFKQLVCEQAFKYGIPDESQIEMRVGDGYEALTGSESEIASGEYRIKYTLENGTYSRNGYVYVSYSVKPAQAENIPA